jgi:hydrogenase maturation protein HypF
LTVQPAADAVEVSVTGVVQGVGFRPFIHRLAVRHNLCGWVRNEAGEVRIVVAGSGASVSAFVAAIEADAPPLARIDSLETRPTTLEDADGFRIVESEDHPDRRQPVSPDVALCADCERELYDEHDRRFRYPFITCTNCGPRFTVIDAMPYDRERTSMRAFPQCEQCRAEYERPDDRRYHSESNACPACGPRVWVEGAGTPGADSAASIAAIAAELVAGRIAAIRGLGGFHLAVDATNDAAVRRLRERKAREAKPLAVMVRTVDDARRLGQVGPEEERLLSSPERPIVLLQMREDSGLADAVAPGLDTVGVMTAYTPLHHLLLDEVARPLVMTSGNRSEEPIATDNQDARARLGDIADAFLLHDREIVARYDDSVVRVTERGPVFLRRARGFAPLPLALPIAAPRPLVAVGPHLKNTFTLVHGDGAYVSQHIGDLENLETLGHFRASLAMYERLFRITPEVVARDLHPGYLSTQVAEDLQLGTSLPVQHHHAHVAAVAAEHGVTERVIGIAYDGTGYGDDGAVWGAEILLADLCGYERRCHLRYAALPGGDVAARQPWRVALGYVALAPDVGAAFSRAFDGIPPAERAVAAQQVERNLNAPIASSMGRLFDAAAAVLGTRRHCHYEGQAAMELEALAGRRRGIDVPFPVVEDGEERFLLDPLPLLAALGELCDNGVDVGDLAAGFHDAVARSTAEVAARLAEATSIVQVAIGGGVFQNARLLERTAAALEAHGLTVLLPMRLSPNDGAISYGQAAIAAALLQRDSG